MTVASVVVEVGPAHLDHPFDYLVPDGTDIVVGQRVHVPFAGRRRLGWVVGVGEAPEPAGDPDGAAPGALRELAGVDGPWSWFDAADLALYRWVADRYGGTLSAVLRHLVPPRVAAVDAEAAGWEAPPAWQPADRPPCPQRAWRPYGASALLKSAAGDRPGAYWWRVLPGDDDAAMTADLVARCLASGRTALVASADPASPLAQRVLAVAGVHGADLRGAEATGLARARYRAVLRCRIGHARVAVGGRGAILAPLPDLGLVVVEDEANPAYKERRAPRHHAREVALARARMAGATAVLTGDLPSAALWRLVAAGHVRTVAADRASERDRAPRVDVVDLGDPRPGARRARLSQVAARALTATVRAGGAGAVLAARRGEGTALACRSCGRRRACPICDGAVGPAGPATVERGRQGREAGRGAGSGPTVWACPTCRWEGPGFACRSCRATETAPLAAGAGRLASELARSHPDAEVARMEGFDAEGPASRPAIAVMTRGSVVARPRWLAGEQAAVVVVPDADALLGRPRLDAGEDALRLWLSAGRWARHLVVQTREPAHPAVQALVRWDPEGFWRRETERRAELAWPPHSSLVRLSADPAEAAAVAGAVRAAVPGADEVLGPDPDGSVLVKSTALRGTLDALTPLRHDWGKRSLRVRVDVDPVDL